MAKDEAERFVGIEEALLISHDERVSTLVIGAVAAGVLGPSLLIPREITVMELFDIEGDKAPVHRLGGELAIGLFEPQPDLPEAGSAIFVVDAVMRDSVDEEQREDLDTTASEGTFLLQVLLYGLVDHGAHNFCFGAADCLP